MSESGTNFAVLCGRDTVQVIPEKDRVLSLVDAERVADATGQSL